MSDCLICMVGPKYNRNMFSYFHKSILLWYSLVSGILLLHACRNEENVATINALNSKADSITIVSQQHLLLQVAQAISEGGTSYAVDFCNVHAHPIFDSLSQVHDIALSRVTDKPRNPANSLKTQTDSMIFTFFKNHPTVNDTFISSQKPYVYYKRIHTAMPTCMKCHGGPQDIDSATLALLDQYYPGDKAKGYQLNDLRGMWKISFSLHSH